MSILQVSLRQANQEIDEKNNIIEEIKAQCVTVTTQLGEDWKLCYDEKLLEINVLQVNIFIYLNF